MRSPLRRTRARRPPLTSEERDALLDDLLRHRDAQAEAYRAEARRQASPCLAGCHGCCHLLALAELPDALLIARRLLATGAATPALRRALEESAARASRLTPDEHFGSAAGCLFLDRAAPAAACSIYDVRPNECRTWYLYGVPDGAGCGPGSATPLRERLHVTMPELEEAELRYSARWAERFWAGFETRPVWVPIALATLAALDVMEHGPGALAAWRSRLDEATQRSYALVDEVDELEP